MCQASKTGFLYELANHLLRHAPGRVGELFPLSSDGAVYAPHRLENVDIRQVELALRATISAISLRYKLTDQLYEELDTMFDDGQASPKSVAELLVDLTKEVVCDEGLSASLEAIDLRKGSHFMMLQAVVVLFRTCLADNPRANYDFLGSVFYALDKEVEEAVTAAVNEAVEDGLDRIKAAIGETEFKKIVEEETKSALSRFPRIGRIIFFNAVGRAIEAAVRRADELALAKIPPLPPVQH
ncbi:MAG: hypothetical protein HY813_01335 [Candidatus Portnoybacteria bacterium]|nr:hypothetical protein [Candidatus Portnoybacteria bacterium]